MSTDKLDLYRKHKSDYVTPTEPAVVDIARANYLAIDGRGKPGGEEFQEAIGALYAGAFTAKMASKAKGRDYTVCKLEALWWAEGASLREAPPDRVRYKLMIRTPDFIGTSHLQATRKLLAEKGKAPHIEGLQLETIEEGRCVQMLHVGPYEREVDTVKQMADFAAAQGLVLHGRHHEIYLSDPRRVPPERLRTILRNPVRPA